MARKPLTKPRKHASQERSRATVDALIEATARILVREGFDSASTNRIAEQAGVSVGSLYQYFPGKEALVAAVIERHKQDLMRVARGVLAEARGTAAQAGGAQDGHRRRSKRTRTIRSCIACWRNRCRARASWRTWTSSIAENYALFKTLPGEPPRRDSRGRPGPRGIRVRDVDRVADAHRGPAPLRNVPGRSDAKRWSTRRRGSSCDICSSQSRRLRYLSHSAE